MPSFISLAQEKALDQDAQGADKERTNDETEPEVSEEACDRIGEIGPEHVERGVGQVQYAHHPENEGQTRCHEKQEHPVHQTVDSLNRIVFNR